MHSEPAAKHCPVPAPSAWNLYAAVGLQVRYEPTSYTADVTIQPMSRVSSECVRGGTCTLTTRLQLDGLR